MVELLIEKNQLAYSFDVAMVHVGMSVGVAVYPLMAILCKPLCAMPTLLFMMPKGAAGGVFAYRPELTESANLRLMLDADLRTAINNEEFEIYYQPLIDINSGQVSSVEALLRWNHPKKKKAY